MTYSVVAFDSASGRFGVAVASCVALDVLRRVPGEVPSRGAFVTQSFLFDDSRTAPRDRLEEGASAEETLAALIDPAFDPDFQLRQYSVVDADGGASVFTGESGSFVAAHRSKRFGPFVYTVQGQPPHRRSARSRPRASIKAATGVARPSVIPLRPRWFTCLRSASPSR